MECSEKRNRYLQQLLRQVKGQQQQEHQQELEQSAGTKRQVDVAFGADEIEIDSGIPGMNPSCKQ